MKLTKKTVGIMFVLSFVCLIALIGSKQTLAFKNVEKPSAHDCKEIRSLYKENPEYVSELHTMSTGDMKDPATNKLAEFNQCTQEIKK